MPFNSSGVYTVPAGTTATNNTTIYAEPYNNFLADLKRAVSLVLPRTVTGPMRANLPAGANQVTNLSLNDGTPYEAWRGGDIIAGDETVLETSPLISSYDIISFAETLNLAGTSHCVVLVEGGGTLRGITGSFEGPRFFVFTGSVTIAASATFLASGPGELVIPAGGGIGLRPISSAGDGTLDAWQVDYLYTGGGSLPGYEPPYCYASITQGLAGLWFAPTTAQWPASGYTDNGGVYYSTGMNCSTLTTMVGGRRERFSCTFPLVSEVPGTEAYYNNPATFVLPYTGRNTGKYYFEVQLVSISESISTGVDASWTPFGLVSCLGVSLDFGQNTDFVYYQISSSANFGWTCFGGAVASGPDFGAARYTRLGVAVDCDLGKVSVYSVTALSSTLLDETTYPALAGRTVLPFVGHFKNVNGIVGVSGPLTLTYDLAYLGSEFVSGSLPIGYLPWIS